jgi:ATP-dependent RNA helicase RhlE
VNPNQNPFADLGLLPDIVRATADENYTEPTPVQREVIPAAVTGRDVLACAQTGTGKTAAFVLPILHQLASGPRGEGLRVLILTPTRELAAQIGERVQAYGKYLRVRHSVIYGGVSQFRQETALRQRPELLVATPGRLLDLMNQGLIKLDRVAHFVLDEADRMLDMGFIHDVRRVLAALPKVRQTLFFSATVPEPIAQLAQNMLKDPVRVSVTPKVTAAETIDQSVVFVPRDQKGPLLEQMLASEGIERAIVFTRTKHGADKLARKLEKAGIEAPAIHGNKSQNARERALAGFRTGKTRVLIATDIAARGIDIDGVSHVFNFDLPNVPESYVHRIGRTGRAGATGRAISFCDRDERPFLADIERLLRQRLRVLDVALPRVPVSDTAARSDERAPQARSGNERPRQDQQRPNHDRSRQGQERPNHDRPAPRFGHQRPGQDRPAPGRFSNDRGPQQRPAPRSAPPATPPRAASGARGDQGPRPAAAPWWQRGPQRGPFENRGS